MKKLQYILFLLVISINSESYTATTSGAVEQDGCSTKKTQIMKPEFPPADVSGYVVVNFNINEKGSLEKIRAGESMCVIVSKRNKSAEMKSCGIFKRYAVNAARFLKYKPPLNTKNEACSLQGIKHRYTFYHDKSELIENTLNEHFLSKSQ